jgi:arylsulfatase A-like enzyme
MERSYIQQSLDAIFGGSLIASLLGLSEAIWLLNSTGTPEQLSLVYSVILYGIIGGGIGLFAGIFGILLGKVIPLFANKSFAWGGSGASFLMGAFLLRYQLNKVVYAEQGVPGSTMILIVLGLLGFALFLFFGLPKVLNGRNFFIQSKGAALLWGELILLSGAISFASMSGDDPAAKAYNKTIPKNLQDKPNIIFLMIDTLRADYVGAYNAIDITTPHLDALANDGVLFEHCISQASWTRPSGVSMFTGRLPSGHSTQTKAARVPDEAILFTELAQDSGITVGGLTNNINLTATFNMNQGFDTFLYEMPNYPFGGTESVFGLTFYKVVAKVMERLSPSHRVVHNYYQPAKVVLQDAKSFISANSQSRWMLYAHLMEPHDPYFEHPIIDGSGKEDYNGVAYGRAEHEQPDPSDTEYLKKVYKQEIEFLDLEIGRFVTWLKDNGHYDNSAIVVISDHGEEFNEHGGFWHGTTLYNEVLQVPLLIKTPKNHPKKAERIPWQVRSIDVAPTITSLLGLKADPSWEGEDLFSYSSLPVAKNDCESHPMERIAVAENDFEGNILSSIQMNNFKYILANKDNPRGLNEEELYNLIADSIEKNNLSNSDAEYCSQNNKERKERLKLILGELLKESQSTAVRSDGAELDEATIERMRALGYME